VVDDSTVDDLQDRKQYGHKILGRLVARRSLHLHERIGFLYRTGTELRRRRPGGGTQYWVVNGPLRVHRPIFASGTAADPNFYFQPTTSSGTAEFTPPPAGTINPQRVRDMFYGPGAYYINSAPFKDFRINERMKFTFRWEQYNTLNHPNWSGPNTTPTSAAFGKITTKSGQRESASVAQIYILNSI